MLLEQASHKVAKHFVPTDLLIACKARMAVSSRMAVR